jgi:hypothetical protein
VAQFSRRDETISVLIEHSEGLANLLLAVRVLHFASHHREELGEIDRSIAVGIWKKNGFIKSLKIERTYRLR